MKEESQIDEMRAAVRGDRERAEQARQRTSENVLGLLEPQADEDAPERSSRSCGEACSPPARQVTLAA